MANDWVESSDGYDTTLQINESEELNLNKEARDELMTKHDVRKRDAMRWECTRGTARRPSLYQQEVIFICICMCIYKHIDWQYICSTLYPRSYACVRNLNSKLHVRE